jgi:hypothetical protein
MCTVSWIRRDEGYQLFSNRDEQRTRRRAAGPQTLLLGGVRALAPLDGEFGGTWIAANEFGLSLCLLNGSGGSPLKLSRGLVIMRLIQAKCLAEAGERIAGMDLSEFAPFSLLGLGPGSPAVLFRWDGSRLAAIPDADRQMPLVSSSFDGAGAEVERRGTLERLQAESGGLRTGSLLAFHRSHEPAQGAYSPCMHREDAETVSFTWVTVSAAEVRLYYAPGAPCSSLAGESRTLRVAALKAGPWQRSSESKTTGQSTCPTSRQVHL